MPAFLSPSQSARLRQAAKRYKGRVKLGRPLDKWTDEELWRKVLGQVVVIGRAEPGERIQHEPSIIRKVSLKKLERLHSDAARQKYLHELFVKLRVRFSFGSTWKNDWKAEASANNFRRLMKDGGPKKFFEKIANSGTEDEKIIALQKILRRYGDKSARDTLIELRLAENCMALDARIFGVLKKVGVLVSPKDIYKQVEKELKEKVAEPLGISAALLDRILFKKYEDILKDL